MIKKIILKVIVFVLVATGSAFMVNKINNINIDKVSREMKQSTLPKVYCYMDGKIVNSISGYTQVMSTSLMRDSIMPMGENHMVQVLVDESNLKASTYSYELRSIAGDNLIEKGELDNNELTPDGYRKLSIQFRMDMEKNHEYVLVVIINENEKKIRYYTRVSEVENAHAAEMIDYAYEFHNGTYAKTEIDKDNAIVYDQLTFEDANNSDLSHVSLDSSYEMVNWVGENIIPITSQIPTIVDLDKEFALVKFSYIAESYNEDDQHYFAVNEYFGMRYDESAKKVELLTFDRYQESFFAESYINRSNNAIAMGIATGEDLEYQTSPNRKKIAFVRQGELWMYDYDTAELISVFSYIQGNYTNGNANNQKFDINIDSLDDDGKMYFTVYGYTSRGEHEGENGIASYCYTDDDSRIEEQLFISCNEPYDVMRKDVGRFTYRDEKGNYYYLIAGKIYKIENETQKQIELTSQIDTGKYMVSDNRRIVAYPNSNDEREVTEIIIHNFETDSEYKETTDSSSRLLALGFVENDLIYGEAKSADIAVSSDGKVTLPLGKIYIIQPTGDIVKTYEKNGVYTMNSYVGVDKIYLKRALKQNNFFVETDADFISYKKNVDDEAIVVDYISSPVENKLLALKLPSDMYISNSSLPVMTKHRENENYKEYTLETTVQPDKYFVFDNLGFTGEYNTAGYAIEQVVGKGDGLVVNSEGDTIYRNQDATSYNTVADAIDEVSCSTVNQTLMTCAYMCIEYVDNRIAYEDVMKCDSYEDAFAELTTGTGINISGIELSTALYFLDRDIPFAASIGSDGRYVLVISYNDSHIRYYDPLEGEEVKVTRKEFESLLSEQGNTMYTFAK